MCLLWDYGDLLELVNGAVSVKAVFAGHDHAGGYHLERKPGVRRTPGARGSSAAHHHVTLEGVIEAPPGKDAFATLDFHRTGLLLRGRGKVKSRWLPFYC